MSRTTVFRNLIAGWFGRKWDGTLFLKFAGFWVFEWWAMDMEWRSAISEWDAWCASGCKGPSPFLRTRERWEKAPWWRRLFWSLRARWKYRHYVDASALAP